METAVVHARTMSTEAFPEDLRIAAWRDFMARSVGELDIEPLHDQPFRVESTYFGLPDIGVQFTRHSDAVARMHRAASDLRAGTEAVSLAVLSRGRLDVAQGGGEAYAGAGCGLASTAPGKIAVQGGFEAAFVHLPLPRLAAAAPAFDPRRPVAVPAGTGALRQLALYLDVVRQGGRTLGADVAGTMADHLFDLSILALGATGEAREQARLRGGAAARSQEVLRAVDAGVTDPGLSLAAIAALLGFSENEVRDVVDRTGEAFGDRLEARRLDLAMRRLASPAWNGQSVDQIARLCGFHDVERFRRRFRARFGDSPAAFRKRPLN